MRKILPLKSDIVQPLDHVPVPFVLEVGRDAKGEPLDQELCDEDPAEYMVPYGQVCVLPKQKTVKLNIGVAPDAWFQARYCCGVKVGETFVLEEKQLSSQQLEL